MGSSIITLGIGPRAIHRSPAFQSDQLNEKNVIIIGGGPSGLTAALDLVDANVPVAVLERNAIVGGIARTETYKGFHFDMGGHRFFSKSIEVNNFWERILSDRFLTRPRQSRIYYRGKFFNYPLKAVDTFLKLGAVNSFLILISCLRWKAFPYKEEATFEQWVTNRFGKRLFKTFFESYTEKVWGIPCNKLSADWAAQRIKGLSLKTVILTTCGLRKTNIKSLIETFKYPEKGPGMMWEEVANRINQRGGQVRTEAKVTEIYCNGSTVESVEVAEGTAPAIKVAATDFISSMPLSELVLKMEPSAPPEVRTAAEALKYRDFLTVCLILDSKKIFTDNWIYIHDPSVKVGRIQNYRNWSPMMVPNEHQTSLGLEYFCNEGDELWNMADADLIELGIEELTQLGLTRRTSLSDGCVFRVDKSYPVYDETYKESLSILQEFIESFDNLQTIGRNGLHRYNNQDHAMITGMIAARNVLEPERGDVWSVNEDRQYHETARAES